jgi:hypothetical protein
MSWQPIETVPKEGNGEYLGHKCGPWVLLSDGGSEPVVGFWNGRYFDDGNFHSAMEGFTHWMPLPDPPQSQAEAGKP